MSETDAINKACQKLMQLIRDTHKACQKLTQIMSETGAKLASYLTCKMKLYVDTAIVLIKLYVDTVSYGSSKVVYRYRDIRLY